MTGAAAQREAREPHEDRAEQTSWPQELSHEPQLRIGDVRARLETEFPLLSVSKIRHFEMKGLISPHRTASNQRLYSEADAERLRFVLAQQRDRYLPLDQIRELLAQLDAGERLEDVASDRMRVVPESEIRRPQPGTRLTLEQMRDLTGASVADLERMVHFGILHVDARGRFTSQAPEIVLFAQALLKAGFDLRQIRAIATSAHAHAVTIANATAAERAKKTPVARQRAMTKVGEDAATMVRLYRALLGENVEIELR